MGHHLDGKSNIVPLIDRLNKYPIGLPDTDKLRRILAILFSEDEAYVASRFPLTEATLPELVKATDWEQERLAVSLGDFAKEAITGFRFTVHLAQPLERLLDPFRVSSGLLAEATVLDATQAM